MTFIDRVMSRTRLVLFSLVFILLIGIIVLNRIPKEATPDVSIPIVYVSLSLAGISPSDAERLLVRPVENALKTIEGVEEMSASAYRGGGFVLLTFDAGFDADLAMTDVREEIDKVQSDLPADADEPTVNEVNLSLEPIISVSLSGRVPERILTKAALDLKDAIEVIPEVLEADISGSRDERVEIIISPEVIESYNISVQALSSFFRNSNRLVAAGNLDTGEGAFSVSVPGLFAQTDDLGRLPVVGQGDAVSQLDDVATVLDTFADRKSYARVDGLSSITLSISKRTGTNIIDTIVKVREVVASMDFPEGVEITIGQDRSEDIKQMIGDLRNNVISAVLLVMIVVIATLGVRSGLLVGVAIPGSFLTGIMVIYAMGLTMNMVVLFALILAVGLLVDGAIVVVEYSEREMREGQNPTQAFSLAARRMAWPIIASTLTTLAAFAPLLFWPRVVGQFMRYLPLTLIATLAASLVMALIFVPTLGAFLARWQKSKPKKKDTQPGFYTQAYLRFLRGAFKQPGGIMFAAFSIFVFVVIGYGKLNHGVLFFPNTDPESATVLVHSRGNLSVAENDQIMRQVEQNIAPFEEYFDAVYTKTEQTSRGGDVGEDVIGNVFLDFRDWQERPPGRNIINEVRHAIEDIPGILTEVRETQGGPPTGKPIQVRLGSRNPELLPGAVDQVRTFLEQIPGIVDIEDNRPPPAIEWEIEVDRAQAYKYGVDIGAIGDSVKLVTDGLKLSSYRPDNTIDEVDIVARYPHELRSFQNLENIRVVTSQGSVPITNFVQLVAKQREGTLTRLDAIRTMTVKADLEPGLLANDKMTELQAWLATGVLHEDIVISFTGDDKEQAAAQEFLGGIAFPIAIFMMFVVLLMQFNSFYNSFLILSAIVFSIMGVLIGLTITGEPFGIVMTGIGVISLAGIIVNNNIVLIDTYGYIRRTSGLDVTESLLQTCRQRFRPVLLTTTTTVLGLTPMVLQMNIDFLTREITLGAPSTQWWVSLATAIVFGLIFATPLTLVVTPCALMWREQRRGQWFLWLRRDRTTSQEA
ncbi:MAG: efflux RND transporter permease subunit [Pseudomonadota bacterium]